MVQLSIGILGMERLIDGDFARIGDVARMA